MATKINCLLYAQNCANRVNQRVIIYQSKNGQWLYTKCNEDNMLLKNAEIVSPKAAKCLPARELNAFEYRAISDLYNNCNEAYRTLGAEWKQAFMSRLYRK